MINDDSASHIKNVDVIYDLIKKVKDLPTFIDVVRVGVRDPTDDWRLRELAKDSGGNFVKIENLKDLKKVLAALAPKKPLKNFSFGSPIYLFSFVSAQVEKAVRCPSVITFPPVKAKGRLIISRSLATAIKSGILSSILVCSISCLSL